MAIQPILTPQYKGNQAAGAFICAADTGRFLLGLRSKRVDSPGVWGQFGGGIEHGETREGAIQREVWEEAGYDGPIFIRAMKANSTSDFTYHNHAAVVPKEFEPRLNDETDRHVWCDLGKWPEPLHPGILKLFQDPVSMAILKDTCERREYLAQFCKRYGVSNVHELETAMSIKKLELSAVKPKYTAKNGWTVWTKKTKLKSPHFKGDSVEVYQVRNAEGKDVGLPFKRPADAMHKADQGK